MTAALPQFVGLTGDLLYLVAGVGVLGILCVLIVRAALEIRRLW